MPSPPSIISRTCRIVDERIPENLVVWFILAARECGDAVPAQTRHASPVVAVTPLSDPIVSRRLTLLFDTLARLCGRIWTYLAVKRRLAPLPSPVEFILIRTGTPRLAKTSTGGSEAS